MNAQQQAGQLSSLFGPGVAAGDTQRLFQLLMGSPAFQSMMQNISLQGNQISQNLNAGLAQRGLTGTGVGTIASSLGSAVPGFMQTQAKGQLFSDAMSSAMQNLLARLGSYTQLEQQRRSQPSTFGRIAGGVLGAAGTAIPFLHSFGGGQQTQPGWSAGQNWQWQGPGLGG